VIISNSEVETFQKCQRKHWYAYGLNLAPREKALPLRSGILGHSVLEKYYRAKRAELSHDECVQEGLSVLAAYMLHPDVEVYSIVLKRFLEYAEHYKHEPFRVLDVEGIYTMPLDNGIEYALTLDLLVEYISGQYKGQQVLIDHKWTSDFWSADAVDMLPQIPKYLHTLRRLGSTADFGIVNQIRYRKMKDGYDSDRIFRRSHVKPTKERIANIVRIHEKVTHIIRQRKIFPDLWEMEAVQTIYRQQCDNCFFRTPCQIELDGRDASRTFAAMFEQNTYGYRDSSLRKVDE
jgi:hypothetical protein